MKIRNQIEYCVSANYALFSDPIARMGGEKFSYMLPTYQALKGITAVSYTHLDVYKRQPLSCC